MSEDQTSSILRGVRVLVGLAELGRPVSSGVLAEALGLPPSSAHRILAVLKKAGYVSQDRVTGSYGPGTGFLRAATAFSAASQYPAALSDALDDLVAECAESAYYGAYLSAARRFRFLGRRYSDHAVQYVARQDKTYSLLWGASGRAIAAFLPMETRRAIYERERDSAEGQAPLSSWERLEEELAQVRNQGFCSTDGHRFEGAHSTAVPVFGHGNEVIGCLGISMPSLRRDESRIPAFVHHLTEAAKGLTYVAQCAIEPPHGDAFLLGDRQKPRR